MNKLNTKKLNKNFKKLNKDSIHYATHSGNQYRNWCFTWNNYPEDHHEQFEQSRSMHKFKYVYQKETCPVTKTKHLQGYLENPKGVYFQQFLLPNAIHWEARGSLKRMNALTYCTDLRKRDEETPLYFTPGMKGVKDVEKRVLKRNQLRPWQEQLVDICKKDIVKLEADNPDDRTLYWIWDKEGCSGKSQLAKHLYYYHNGCTLQGRAVDIMLALAQLQELGDTDPYVCLIPLTRIGVTDNLDFYHALEQIKDGFFVSTKWKNYQVDMPSPVTIIFANQEPEMGFATRDRYMIYELLDGRLELTYNGKEEFLKEESKGWFAGFVEE